MTSFATFIFSRPASGVSSSILVIDVCFDTREARMGVS